MTEHMIPVPESLVRRVMLMLDGPYAGLTWLELRALLSQPGPSALPHFCTPGCTDENCPVEPFTNAEAAELRALLSDRGLETPAEPVSIADMAPGATFGSTVDQHNTKVLRFMRTSEGVVDEDGTYWPVADIDPSTIRDIVVPPATPEA